MESGVKRTPYLEKMRELLDPLKLTPLKDWRGRNLLPAGELSAGATRGSFNAYSADRIEKIGIGSLTLSDRQQCAFCSIIPREDYDLPLFLSRFEEGEDHVTLLVDIIPTVDSLIDEEYRKKYIESAQPLWERYASLPGICPEESDIIRSLLSIIYTAARVPIEKEGMRLAALAPHTEYLKSYLAFVSTAAPVADEAKLQELRGKRGALRKTLNAHFFKEMLPAGVRGDLGDAGIGLLNHIFF